MSPPPTSSHPQAKRQDIPTEESPHPDLPKSSPARARHEFSGRQDRSGGRLSISPQAIVLAAHGVYTVGRGAVAMPLPMKKLGCGGWL